MANQRNGAPSNWLWREGRPRWHPSPTLRRAGWKGCDLKDAGGAWLGKGASVDRAEAINAAVAAWRAGELVAPGFAAMAPVGAAERGGVGVAAGRAAAPDRLSIGALADAWTGTATTRASHEFAALKPATRRDYAGKLKRLVDVLAGWAVLPPRDAPPAQRAAYAAAVAEARAMSVLVLEPEETAAGVVDLLHGAYWTLKATSGAHQASGVLAAASAWLGWCRERQSRRIRNWAQEVSRETPPGRIRPLTWPEVKALVWAADTLGLHSMGDAIVLGVDLSWSQCDRLALSWDRARGGRCLAGRQKTGRVGGTPLLPLGRARLAQALRRHRALPAMPTHVLWCERTAAPWKPAHYRHVFAGEVRPLAATVCPSVADATDADLRDTAVTYAHNAGLSIEETCSRTLQSRRRVQQLWDRSYGEIGPEIADAGAARLGAHFERKGMVL